MSDDPDIEMGQMRAEEDGKSKQNSPASGAVSFCSLFRYATFWDAVMIATGSLTSIINGAAFPLFAVVFGAIIDSLGDPGSNMLTVVGEMSIIFVLVGCGTWICSWVSLTCWMYAAERQTNACRDAYVRSVMSQNIGWFDEHPAAKVSAQLSTDIPLFQAAVGEKVGTGLQHTSGFFIGITIGFVFGWQMALLVMATFPLLAIVMGVMTHVMQGITSKNQELYADAGALSEEVFAAIKSVTAFSGQNLERLKYNSLLDATHKSGIVKGSITALLMGTVGFVMFGTYGLAMWFGAKLIRDGTISPWTGEPYTGGDVITIFFAILMGAMAVGQAGPSVTAVTSGKTAAYKLFQVIDRKSPINARSEDGRLPKDGIQGTITLQDVHFAYPTRTEAPIFKGLDLEFQTCRTTALVGGSGGGKSTVMALIERFYDPQKGTIMVDGMDIRELNVRWWREQIGVVSQEPVLFVGTIKDNIKFGLPEATDEEVIDAAKLAEAHEFIKKLKLGYDTEVGEGGMLLSGGQKQRIAIARAVLRDPKILLLDEATSALDPESERAVQRALDRVMEGRTTIVIAHRLSTIRNADKLIVIRDGKVVESGTHDELVEQRGAYFHLTQAQDHTEQKDAGAGAGDHIDTDEEKEENEEMALVKRESSSFLIAQERPNTKKDVETKEEESSEKDKENDDKVKWNVPNVPVGRLVTMSCVDWHWIFLGCFGSLINGATNPLWGLFFSDMMAVFYEPDPEKSKSLSAWLALAFFGVGCAQLVGSFLYGIGFSISGGRLTRKLRKAAYQNVLDQEMGFFDNSINNSSVLSARLATDASEVQGAFSGQIPGVVMSLGSLIGGIIIGVINSWRLTLVIFAMFPVLAIAGALQMKFFTGYSEEGTEAFATANRISSEAFTNVRTVASFTSEQFLIDRYDEALKRPQKIAKKKAIIAGFAFGFSQGVMFFSYALCFWYGAKLIDEGKINFEEMFAALFAVLISVMALGQAQQFTPDFAKAKESKNNVFYMIDRESTISSSSKEGKKPEFESKYAVEFDDVSFSYPTRPDDTVLHGLSFKLRAGKSLGLVGESGSGKSTVVSLLLKFYDHQNSGSILIDGQSISGINTNQLRQSIGMVSQEPVLFSRSIRENIKYGNINATDEEVTKAAQIANIHHDIVAFPDGYDTKCGRGGSKLSGGQKQRVAIARAIIRSPKILLLDEATSALDSESEVIVQQALDDLVMQKDSQRATIVIAHRLSSVKNCDSILVMDKGYARERGTHTELMEKNGLYANMIKSSLHQSDLPAPVEV